MKPGDAATRPASPAALWWVGLFGCDLSWCYQGVANHQALLPVMFQVLIVPWGWVVRRSPLAAGRRPPRTASTIRFPRARRLAGAQ